MFAFVVLLDLLLHTKALSDYLQQDDLDFVSAIDMVQSLISLKIKGLTAALRIILLKHNLNAMICKL